MKTNIFKHMKPTLIFICKLFATYFVIIITLVDIWCKAIIAFIMWDKVYLESIEKPKLLFDLIWKPESNGKPKVNNIKQPPRSIINNIKQSPKEGA